MISFQNSKWVVSKHVVTFHKIPIKMTLTEPFLSSNENNSFKSFVSFGANIDPTSFLRKENY